MILNRISRKLVAPLRRMSGRRTIDLLTSTQTYGLLLALILAALSLPAALRSSSTIERLQILCSEAFDPAALQNVSAVILLFVAGFLLLKSRRDAARPQRRRRSSDRCNPKADVHDEASKSRLTRKRLKILGTFMNDHHKLLPSDMTVGDLMTAVVRTALPTTPIATLRAIAAEYDIRHILICSEDQELVGVVSDRDLRHLTQDLTAADLMASCPTTITSQSLVNNAISILLYGHISSLPVVDEGRLVGILTTTDVVMTLQCAMLAVERIMKDLGSEPSHAAKPCATN